MEMRHSEPACRQTGLFQNLILLIIKWWWEPETSSGWRKPILGQGKLLKIDSSKQLELRHSEPACRQTGLFQNLILMW